MPSGSRTGSAILISNDAARGPGHPLRPAVIEPDGSGLRELDGTQNPDLNLGCGDVSSDGTRIVVEGFTRTDSARNGIYSIRASDGGDLRRLTTGLDGNPQYSPDGTRVVFMRTAGGPAGRRGRAVRGRRRRHRSAQDHALGRRLPRSGVVPGRSMDRIPAPYGQLFLVHPDGSDLHQVPVTLPSGSGARQPSWSPDGAWIVFSLTRGGGADLYAVRPDGSDLVRLTDSPGSGYSSPEWGP